MVAAPTVRGAEGSTKRTATVGCRRAGSPDWRTLKYFCEKRQGQGTHGGFFLQMPGNPGRLGNTRKSQVSEQPDCYRWRGVPGTGEVHRFCKSPMGGIRDVHHRTVGAEMVSADRSVPRSLLLVQQAKISLTRLITFRGCVRDSF